MHFAQVRTRRVRSERKEICGIDGGEGAEIKKGHSTSTERTIASSSRISAVFGVVGGIAVALKLHKYALVGGSLLSPGVAAVIAEDLAVFVALCCAWHALCAILLRVVRVDRDRAYSRWFDSAQLVLLLLLTIAHWIVLLAVALLVLACVAVEHVYFWSTRSLLDADALLVAQKSLRPILFIAIEVEGQRTRKIAVFVAVAMGVLAAVVLKVRAALVRMSQRQRHNTFFARFFRTTGRISGLLLNVRAALGACAVCIVVATMVFTIGLHDDNRLNLLRRNCFVGVALDMRSTPPGGGGEQWVSAVFDAFSSRIVGGISTGSDPRNIEGGVMNPVRGGRGVEDGDGSSKGGAKPNVVIVVLESTSGTLVTPSDSAGVSPWARELAQRGMSSTSFYSSMPNTNKAMFQVMCGMTPSLETSWVEFEREDVLKAVCLPGLLRSKLGYESLFLTGSMVGGLGCFGFDKAIGYAGTEEQGGRTGFKKRSVHDKFSFKHGAFEKVNYLGYDDHVVLDQSISFLLGRDGHSKKKAFKKSKSKIKKGSRRRLASGHGDAKDGGKLLTILTVGPHHFHDVPSDFSPREHGTWAAEASNLMPRQGSVVGPLREKYLSALRYQDLFLERLYKQLDETGLAENTYVVVVGDHGEAFEEHSFDKHGNNVYQEGLLVPFFLTGPSGESRIQPGKNLDRVGMHADIAPTVLDLLGLWKPDTDRGQEEDGPQNALPAAHEPLTSQNLLDESDTEGRRNNGVPESERQRLRGVDSAQGTDRKASLTRAVAVGSTATAATTIPPGSGLIGDSLLGPDERGCALGATHYGGKTLAVMAGDWKAVFLYRWDRIAYQTRAVVVNAQLFDLTADPREQHNLLQHGGAGGCCLSCTRASASNGKPCMSMTQDPAVMLNVDQPLRQSDVSISCGAAGRIPVPSRDPGPQQSPADESNTVVDRSAEVCCHLQRAATSFAGNNLRFFGRQP